MWMPIPYKMSCQYIWRRLRGSRSTDFKKWKLEHFVTTRNESAPIQLAQCWFLGLAICNAKKINIYFFQIKYTQTVLSISTGKLLWFWKMLIAIKKQIYCVIYYDFRHTFVPYTKLIPCISSWATWCSEPTATQDDTSDHAQYHSKSPTISTNCCRARVNYDER